MSFGANFKKGAGLAAGILVVLALGGAGGYWYLKKSVRNAKDAVVERVHVVKDRAATGISTAKETVQDAAGKVGEKTGAAYGAVKDKVHEIGEKAGPTVQAVKEGMRDKAHDVSEKAKTWFRKSPTVENEDKKD